MDFPTLFRIAAKPRTATPESGFKRALALFREAASRVPAYKDFLDKNGVHPESVSTKEDFERLPRTDKPGYISKYSLSELSWDGTLDAARYISTSSGSTGVPFFWPRGVVQDATTGHIFRGIYQDIFKAREKRVLFVNSFALGTWIAGFEFYNAHKWVGDQNFRITIVTPGIDKSEAVNQIRALAPLYDTVVIGGYPPFVKDIVETCEDAGIDMRKVDIHLLVAGEAISVAWKQKLTERLGKPSSYSALVNVYGMAEAGVVAHDTPLSQLVRENPQLLPTGTLETHDGLPVTGLYQYHPELRYFEAHPGEALALTADAGIPLIRYDTRDTGGLFARSVVESMGVEFRTKAETVGVDMSKWQLPFVYLNGRKDLSISFYALIIYVENIKYALEGSSYSPMLSGLFTMGVEHNDNLDQQFIIRIELAGEKVPHELEKTLEKEIVAKLQEVNSEYSKLLASIGDKAKPKVVLLPHGEIQTVPGRKHKWVIRK